MICFSFEIDFKYGRYNARFNHENEQLRSSVVRKSHMTEVLLILNRFSTFTYVP
jgi:hypothetical protein